MLVLFSTLFINKNPYLRVFRKKGEEFPYNCTLVLFIGFGLKLK